MRKFFSPKNVFTTHHLTIMSLMLVLSMILAKVTTVQASPMFKLFTLSYLPGVAVSALFGPIAAIIYGVAADTLNFIVAGGGAYMPVYAISEAVFYFIFACFLYKRPHKLWRIILAKLISLAVVTFGLNYLWNLLFYGSSAAVFFTSARLIANAVKLPATVALIYYFNKLSFNLYDKTKKGRL